MDVSRDFATLKNDNEKNEWQARKTLLSNLIHAQAAFLARLYVERIQEGKAQSEGN